MRNNPALRGLSGVGGASSNMEWKLHPRIPNLELSSIGDVLNPAPSAGMTTRARNGKLPYRLHYRSGYLCVDIHRDGRRNKCFVHILMAETFLGLGAKETLRVVNHKNGIRSDNRVGNLELVSRSRDTFHAFITKGREPKKWDQLVDPDDGLTEASVHLLRSLYANGVPITDEILADIRVPREIAMRAARRETWTHLNVPDHAWETKQKTRATA